MPAAPLPPDENERLEALEALRILGLDSSREERFDRITRVVQSILDVPITTITIVDRDTQWFKSCLGLEATGSPRDRSFCAYTILEEDPLVVPDALEDARFRDNPFVLDAPSIRFYVGLPLHAPGGRRIGALCAIDSRPRTVSAREMEGLRALAAIAESELNHLSIAQAMDRVIQREGQFRNLVQNSSDIIQTFDPEGRIVYANPASREALGYTEEDIRRGLSIFQVIHPDYIAISRDRLRRLFAGESVPPGEFRIIARDGRVLDVEGTVSCHFENGSPRVACGIYRDITARKALDEESRLARRDAEDASLAKSQFLANISHEIRTPLNGIIGMSSMLMLSGLNENQMRYARTIDSSGHVLLGLVNQILDFSKFQAAAASLEQIAFDLPHLIEEVAALFSVRAQAKGLTLGWYIGDGVPARLLGDPVRLRQVLTNLLGNAVKFTDAGVIRLDVRTESGPRHSAGEVGMLLRFTVTDTGIGLEEDACARIFDAFAQADPSTTRKYGGTGLGLAISRQIVRLMGGDIHVHSIPGKGATFWFTAHFGVDHAGPASLPAPEVNEQQIERPGRSLRLLIAEDNSVNEMVLSEQLARLGHRSDAVCNGLEALEALEKSKWDALLLDCQMPVMDGYETVAAIRRAEAAEGSGHLWIVAVTANAMESHRAACLRAGMDDFLSKPYRLQDLAEVIARIPEPAAGAGPSKPPVDHAMLATMAKSKAVNGENLLDRMVTLFTRSGPEMVDQMEEALRKGDFETAIRAVHKLAGGCSYFGAQDLHTLCMEFERLGRAGDYAPLGPLAERIRQEYARAEQALRRGRPAGPFLP